MNFWSPRADYQLRLAAISSAHFPPSYHTLFFSQLQLTLHKPSPVLLLKPPIFPYPENKSHNRSSNQSHTERRGSPLVVIPTDACPPLPYHLHPQPIDNHT